MTDLVGERGAEVLGRARSVVDPLLRTAVDTLPEQLRRIAAYHFGWQNADGLPTARPAGKALRPALVLAACRALGGGPADGLAAATAVELVHNFTLLHDDVIDRDPTRRHRPTAWAVFGKENAILAGDAMLALALEVLVREGARPGSGLGAGTGADAGAGVATAAAATARLARCVIEICDGQWDDCAFESRDDVSLSECMAMAEKKTGALLGCACALGAMYAGADERTVAALDTYGRQLGVAFQLVDDLLGIWGDPAQTGKPVGADLAARKKSLPIVAALESRTTAGAELARLYADDQLLRADDLRRATEAVELAGARDWASETAGELMAVTRRLLIEALPDLEVGEDLVAIAEGVTRRDS